MKFYSILEGNTQDVLRRFLRLIRNSDARIAVAETGIDDLEDALEELEARVEALENPTTGGTTEGG